MLRICVASGEEGSAATQPRRLLLGSLESEGRVAGPKSPVKEGGLALVSKGSSLQNGDNFATTVASEE
jgi:hypothetical protein